ncbi:Puromycin-sensitive aminopeptidase, putative [Perkinsus marinus ATCC 50983]|uniref:Aminopeptidase n=1 Tax=Perkinsus marinus (strain ATCC 50983 / TXsc) TaxID=423536 RepID=C5KXI6_PERM5|nr:Puromycin-sensitive aminopeptidase, putative [Perkinsus marinus ATCC 50983]EER10710.1 Puromycin-sensitive aminopeptidase, putative [Perkinsus marinus ATCC 50983]|eukprot:XP_002778915.1 Puromycin-sensitive aminopeptidase, putative [Perkinsus marinus ATCC 50983]
MSSPGDSSKFARYVLPDNIVISEYSVHLKPNFETFRFQGTSKISITVKEPTKTIKLHAKELSIDPNVAYTPYGGSSITASSVSVSKAATECTFEFSEELQPGEGELTVEYVGTLNDQMAGFYRSGYVDQFGKKQYMLSTQMESIDARRAFPCIDEPNRKAVFRITITTDAGLQVLSNMPEASRTVFNAGSNEKPVSYQTVEFMPSPKMSSYLVAFCVGQFEFLQDTTDKGTLVRVLCTPGKQSQCGYALEVATRVLTWYEGFFGIPYPLPKLDLIAVPDFAMGAMENWGLVTYREIDLLCDPEKLSTKRRARITSTVTHELAHQWFGNLVTMDWWDGIWLNESFASFMENLSADALYPELGMWNTYIHQFFEGGLQLDGLRSSHPIVVPIYHAEEVDQVFDQISYEKGSAVVRQLWAVLGAEKFQEGVRRYMHAHEYGNSVTEDLWDALEKVSGQPVKEMMDSWTDQMGYPVLEVGPRDSNGNCRVAQSWFLSDGSVKEGDEEKKWVVPILVGDDKTPSGEMGRLTMMREKSETINVGNGKWALLNYGAWVPYRVHYTSAEEYAKILSGVTDMSIPVPNRVNLLGDIFALTKAGRVSPEDAPRVLKAYRNEVDADVWDALSNLIGGLSTICTGLGRTAELDKLVSGMITPLLEKVGWERKAGETPKDRQLRTCLAGLASQHCSSDASLAAKCAEMTRGFLEDADSLAEDVRVPVFRLALAGSESSVGEELWKELIKTAEKYETPQGCRMDIYLSLGYIASPALKKRTLDMCLTNFIKPQDFFYPMGSVRISTQDAAEMTWKWLLDNIKACQARVATASSSLLAGVILNCTRRGFTYEMADSVEKFAKDNELTSISRTISQIAENIRSNASMVERAKKSAIASAEFWTDL